MRASITRRLMITGGLRMTITSRCKADNSASRRQFAPSWAIQPYSPPRNTAPRTKSPRCRCCCVATLTTWTYMCRRLGPDGTRPRRSVICFQNPSSSDWAPAYALPLRTRPHQLLHPALVARAVREKRLRPEPVLEVLEGRRSPELWSEAALGVVSFGPKMSLARMIEPNRMIHIQPITLSTSGALLLKIETTQIPRKIAPKTTRPGCS